MTSAPSSRVTQSCADSSAAAAEDPGVGSLSPPAVPPQPARTRASASAATRRRYTARSARTDDLRPNGAVLGHSQPVPVTGGAEAAVLVGDRAAVAVERHLRRSRGHTGVVLRESLVAAATCAAQVERRRTARLAEGRPVPEDDVAFLEHEGVGTDRR